MEMGIPMVCEFLSFKHKEKLVELATEDDLLNAGYLPSSIRKIKQKKIISDGRCEKLVRSMGDRARPILLEAFQEFAKQLGLSVNTNNNNVDVSQLTRVIKSELESLFEEYFGKPKTVTDFNRVYDFVKDDLGYASIRDIREQLGMTLEQFMAKFRDYIIENYELHSGGKEGIVKGGILYGIIKRKA